MTKFFSPLKTIDFFGGVNITLGLDFVRTSPDHGTGLNIAGSGVANAASLIAAINMARNWLGVRAPNKSFNNVNVVIHETISL